MRQPKIALRLQVQPDARPGSMRFVQTQPLIEIWGNGRNHNRLYMGLKGLTPIKFAIRSSPDKNPNSANL